MTRLVAAPVRRSASRLRAAARRAATLAALLQALPMACLAASSGSGPASPTATAAQPAPPPPVARWSFDMQSDDIPQPLGALLALLGLGTLNLTRRQTSRGVRA